MLNRVLNFIPYSAFRVLQSLVEEGKISGPGSWDVVKWFYQLCLEEFEGYSEGKSGLDASSVQTYKKLCNDDLCSNPQESLLRWREHFHHVLNLRSSFSDYVIDAVRGYPDDESHSPNKRF